MVITRKLFLSFTGTLYGLASGEITQEDLASGLFYFGCARTHAFKPWEGMTNEILWAFKDDQERGQAAHTQLVATLQRGEEEGRVIWREPDAQYSYEDLGILLGRNGYGNVLEELSGPSFDCWRIMELLKNKEIPVEVVFQ